MSKAKDSLSAASRAWSDAATNNPNSVNSSLEIAMTEHEAESPSEAISTENGSDEPGAAAPTSGVFASTSRPESLPEQFWDEDARCVRTDALVASYLELERVAEQSRSAVPASADDYDITVEHELFESDPEINKQLHAAGFSRDQVQLVYSLAGK